MKQGETYKRWKKRYFVLKWQTLYYFKNKPEVNEEGMYTGVYGVINLLNAQVQRTFSYDINLFFTIYISSAM